MMISTCLKQLNNPSAFRSTMVQLARTHNEKGIHGNEYGVVGDVLFYSLQYCLDKDVYDRKTELAWIRIYSAMLRLLLPEVLQHNADTRITDQLSRRNHYLRADMSFKQRVSSNNCSLHTGDGLVHHRLSVRYSDRETYENFFSPDVEDDTGKTIESSLYEKTDDNMTGKP
jgi:hypothetical protein